MGGLKEVYLAGPRGFCAGVKRAVAIVEDALSAYGAPVYVRHEIVHNRFVVDTLRQRGAIFIEDFSEMTDRSRPVIISAHGAPQQVFDDAANLGLHLLDATCPLVARVHKQIKKIEKEGSRIVVIGKKEHPEIIGTIGQLKPDTAVTVINSADEAEALASEDIKTGVVTQTTLAVEQTAAILDILQKKFSNLTTQNKSDICYATTYRQAAVKKIAALCDAVVIIGSPNSSNSRHLIETALQNGARRAWLIDTADELPADELADVESLGISAGASAPEILVQQVLSRLQKDYENLKIHDIIVAEEHIEFKS